MIIDANRKLKKVQEDDKEFKDMKKEEDEKDKF